MQGFLDRRPARSTRKREYLAHVGVLSWSKDSSTVLNWFWQQDINIRNESCWPNSTNKVWPWIIQFCIYYTKSITITRVVSSQLGLVVNYNLTKVNTWYNPQKVAITPFKITLQILFNYCNFLKSHLKIKLCDPLFICTWFLKNQFGKINFHKMNILFYFKLDFYCLCSLQKSISKLIFSG
jgi:hypothetical protein